MLSPVCSYAKRKIPMDGCRIAFGLRPHVIPHQSIGIFPYHLVYMNTSILLVESQVISNRITGFKSKNILKCAFKAKTRRAQCAWCVWRACVPKALPQTGNTKRVTLVYLYHVNRCGHYKKLSIAKLDFVQVCGLSLNFYNNTLRKFYKFSDSRKTWTSPTLQSADWPISIQYHRPQVR